MGESLRRAAFSSGGESCQNRLGLRWLSIARVPRPRVDTHEVGPGNKVSKLVVTAVVRAFVSDELRALLGRHHCCAGTSCTLAFRTGSLSSSVTVPSMAASGTSRNTRPLASRSVQRRCR